MISVDSIHEIKKIVEMQVDSQSKIMIRIRPPHHLSPSRFGISQEEIRSHQSLIMQLGSIYRIYGLHFHIDSINAEDKKQIIRHLIHVREKLLARDISIEQI
jgi:diaminopimelate decarboxylase